MGYKFRCDCPFTSALDILGDRWMLVIVKLMLIDHKQTFKDLAESEEAVATNILSKKLKLLEDVGIVLKTKLPNNKKTNLYLLTEKGLALTHILTELAVWSDGYLRPIHPAIEDGQGMELLRQDKDTFNEILVKKYREKLAITPTINK